jgi:hypothetical protein
VFFYWNMVAAAAGTQTYTLTQSATPSPPGVFTIASGSNVYDSNCNAVSATITQNSATGTVTITFNAGSGGTFYIGIKYSAKAVAGKTVGAGDPTFSYTFALTGVAGSSAGVQLVGSPH